MGGKLLIIKPDYPILTHVLRSCYHCFTYLAPNFESQCYKQCCCQSHCTHKNTDYNINERRQKARITTFVEKLKEPHKLTKRYNEHYYSHEYREVAICL